MGTTMHAEEAIIESGKRLLCSLAELGFTRDSQDPKLNKALKEIRETVQWAKQRIKDRGTTHENKAENGNRLG